MNKHASIYKYGKEPLTGQWLPGPDHALRKEYPQEWSIWYGLKYRCGNPKFPKYVDLEVCERWQEFGNFIEDMGKRPSKKYSIDRINNGKGYSPDNCRWGTQSQQCLNQDRNHMRNHWGAETYDYYWQLAKDNGIIGNTFQWRLRQGWDIKEAATKPTKYRRRS